MNDAERTIEFFSSVVKPTGKILTEEEKQSREYLIQYLLPTVLPGRVNIPFLPHGLESF